MLTFLLDGVSWMLLQLYAHYLHSRSFMKYYWSFMYSTAYGWVEVDNDCLPFTNYGYQVDVDTDNAAVDEIVGGLQDRLKTQIPEHLQSQWHSTNLYTAVLSQAILNGVTLDGKIVMEVGCGGGGGCIVLHSISKPKTYLGVDLCQEGVGRCVRQMKKIGGEITRNTDITFKQGNSMALIGLVSQESFDVVLNVESSHCYSSVARFFEQVHTSLKPGGIFLWCDLQSPKDSVGLKWLMNSTGLKIMTTHDITENVAAALRNGAITPIEEEYRRHVNKKAFLVRLWCAISWHLLGRMAAKMVQNRTFSYHMTCCKKVEGAELEALRKEIGESPGVKPHMT